MKGRTVTVSGFMRHGNPEPIKKAVAEYLLKNGIQRVVVGHKPFGDSPTFMRQHGVEVIDADTSFSDITKPDQRYPYNSTTMNSFIFYKGVCGIGSCDQGDTR